MQPTLSSLIVFLCLSPVVLCYGESLDVLEELTLPADEAAYAGKDHKRLYVGGAYYDDDVALAYTSAGLLTKFPDELGWEKVLGLEPIGNNWWEDREIARKDNVLFSPGPIWRIAGTGELVMFDHYIRFLYAIDIQDRNDINVRLWEKTDNKSYVNSVCFYNDMIFYGIGSGYHDSVLAVSRADLSDYRRVFKCPPELKRMHDSVGANLNCYPAFNPIDSTIWLSFGYYNSVYVIDMDGRLLDSVQITAPDFRFPKPPVSRVKSQAVFQDWYSKCTPVVSFWNVVSGYFLLQYQSGWEKLEPDSVWLLSTLVWTADRRPVELAVNKRWRVVGVQPDGRIIFAHYLMEDRKATKTILTIARIER